MKAMLKVLCVLCLLAGLGFGQTGTVWNQPAFGTATIATIGPGPILRNVGQASHWLQYCTSSGVTAIQIELEASFDGSNWFQISDLGTQTGCAVLEASGYWPDVRANLLSLSGNPVSVTAYYSASPYPVTDGGLVHGGRSSTRVTYVAATGFSDTVVKSTIINVASSPGVVYSATFSNPNASAVYCFLEDGSNQIYDVMVPPSGTETVSITVGLNFGTRIGMSCATGADGLGDPATGVVASIAYKTDGTVNSIITSGGVVNGTRTVGW